MISGLSQPDAWALETLGLPPGRHSDSPDRIRWLRVHLHSYAWFLACLDLAGIAEDWLYGLSAYTEILLAGTVMAQRSGIAFDEGAIAAIAEWADAQERARKFVRDLCRAICPMARHRVAGEQIMRTAHAVNDRYDCALPSVVLKAAARKIAHAVESGNATGRR